MANYQKLQTATALAVIKSDNANIPFPAIVSSGTNTTFSTNQLQCSSAAFVTRNVAVGDVVYNNTTNTAATVTKVLSQTALLLNADIFTIEGQSFTVYANNNKEGCVLYIGTGGNLRVLTAGGQDVTFSSVLGGTFFPVQVLKVFSTGTSAANIVALW